MTLESQKKLAQHIFRLLKVNEIVFPIGRTNNGNLGLKFSQNNDDFEIMLDAVPLSTKDILKDDNNIELKQLLEKYLFEEKGVQFYADRGIRGVEGLKEIVDNGTTVVTVGKIVDKAGNDRTDEFLGKKRGRPTGSKNKPKAK